MYKIKICGITTPDDALLTAEAGADAIGLNFYEKSVRYVQPAVAAEIIEALREHYSAEQVAVFGVFVNASLDEVMRIVREAAVNGPEQGFGVQLHGEEPPEFLRELSSHGFGIAGNAFQVVGHRPTMPIVRAFRCRGKNLNAEAEYLQTCQRLGTMPQAVLIDAYAPGSYGGTGQCVDWSVLASERAKLGDLPIVLAGGLTLSNVADAITACRPAAVDVASGVESAPGRKDAALVHAFVSAAKEAFAS